jgi:hypothetical protein
VILPPDTWTFNKQREPQSQEQAVVITRSMAAKSLEWIMRSLLFERNILKDFVCPSPLYIYNRMLSKLVAKKGASDKAFLSMGTKSMCASSTPSLIALKFEERNWGGI